MNTTRTERKAADTTSVSHQLSPYARMLFKTCLILLIFVQGVLTHEAQASEQITYYHNDYSGTPLLATDASGALIWKENYQPYGNKLNNAAASASNKLGYAGKPYDNNSGLSYMGARYYDPLLGRFMGTDPKGADPEDLHSFNRYAYANNNPYKYVDPDGHSVLDVGFLIYDIGKLGVAIYRGVGVGAATVDVGLSVVGVISPFIGTGEMLKAGRAIEHGVELSREASLAREGAQAAKGAGQAGRAGKQARLRELANDDKLGSADRGWIQQEMNSIERGQRSSIRNPPGKDLAHERGREAAKGYDYGHSNLQDRDLHRLQHKYDDFGRANAERPVP